MAVRFPLFSNPLLPVTGTILSILNEPHDNIIALLMYEEASRRRRRPLIIIYDSRAPGLFKLMEGAGR